MSRFSERCKELITENETTAYRISKTTDLELTSLQRMITGKRLPNIGFVKKFCQALRLPFAMENQLLELYKIEQIGETTFKKYQCILSLISSLDTVAVPQTLSPFLPVRPDQNWSKNVLNHNFYKSELIMQNVLANAFSQKTHGCLYTNIPATNQLFLHTLLLMQHQYADNQLQIKHLLGFQMLDSQVFYNIQTLEHVLPLCFSSGLNYELFFFYSSLKQTDYGQMIFPFYIITDHHVLSLSSDFQSTMLLSDEDSVAFYKKEFEKALHSSTPLIHSYIDPQSAMLAYQNSSMGIDQNVASIEFQPCFLHLMDIDLFLKKIQGQPAEIIALGQQYAEVLFSCKQNLSAFFFTKKGLENFCHTGKFCGQIAAFLEPFNHQEILNVLQRLYDDICTNPDYPGYLLKDDLSISPNMSIECAGNQALRIIIINGLSEFAFTNIEESNICNTFFDFTNYLKDSDRIYSREESAAIVLALMDSMVP